MAQILPEGSRVALYGSRARGDFHDESDWDIHILVPGDKDLSFEEVCCIANPIERVGLAFNEIVNAMVYSYYGWNRRSFLPFYKNVENDKIIIYQN